MEAPVKILVAEDDAAARALMEAILRQSRFDAVTAVADGGEALRALEREPYDILITDLDMPVLPGEVLIRRAREREPGLTVLVTSGKATIEGAVALMKEGIFDFLPKPFIVDVFADSVRRAAERVLENRNVEGQHEAIEVLMAALSRKDKYLKGHCGRVATLAVDLARRVGLRSPRIALMQQAARVHDIGKIAIPEAILNKPSALTDDEMQEIRKHPVHSRDILRPVRSFADGLDFVYYHHERPDGRGYPEGIGGEEIPFEARLIAVVDTYDAMASDRAYRRALPPDAIREVLRNVRGTQLDAGLVDLFLSEPLPEHDGDGADGE
ncbi:MAG: response regulator [Planctomycetes bacterium]|nr:response regulator [Planctomycetota bacterium]